MESFALVAYPVHVALLNFSKKYGKRLIQSEYTSVLFLPVEIRKSEVISTENIEGTHVVKYGSSTFQVLDTGELVQLTSGTEVREAMIRALHQSMRTILYDPESTCTAGFDSRSKHNKELNCFYTLLSYCSDISEGMDVRVT